MIKFQEFNKILKFEKACNDLRSGIPISFYSDNKNFIITTLENIGEAEFNVLSNLFKPKYLIISKERAHYLKENCNDEIMIDITNVGFSEIVDISGLSLEKINIDLYDFQKLKYAPLLEAMKTCIALEMHPSILVFESTIQNDDLNKVSDLNFLQDQKILQTSFVEVNRAPLKLRFTELPVEVVTFRSKFNLKEHYAIIIGDAIKSDIPLVRLHSSCYTGDLLGSITCDCHDQFHGAIKLMAKTGGIILYLMQEGRGIGLINKLRTYNLQNDHELDTVDANLALGFPDDARILWPASSILKILGVNKVRLLTNNPYKAKELTNYGISVNEIVPHVTDYHDESEEYIQTKINKMGHRIKR